MKHCHNIALLCLLTLFLLPAKAQQWDNYRNNLRDKNVKITSTNLPIVFINVVGTTIQRNSYVLGRMKIIDNGPGQLNYGDTLANPYQGVDYEGFIALKYRGNSSFSNSDKKPYQFQTLKTDLLPDNGSEKQKVDILGMGKDNKWAFIAPWCDKVMFRDLLSFELGRPWMDYVPEGRFCEVILDGTYYGVYVICERVSKGKTRLNLHDPGEDEGDLTGDYHVEIDRNDQPNYTSPNHPWSNANGAQKSNYWVTRRTHSTWRFKKWRVPSAAATSPTPTWATANTSTPPRSWTTCCRRKSR